MATRATVDLSPMSMFQLEALEALPCGCVASAYRARSLDVVFVSLEAKGPYCLAPSHIAGQTLRLAELVAGDDEAGGDAFEHRP